VTGSWAPLYPHRGDLGGAHHHGGAGPGGGAVRPGAGAGVEGPRAPPRAAGGGGVRAVAPAGAFGGAPHPRQGGCDRGGGGVHRGLRRGDAVPRGVLLRPGRLPGSGAQRAHDGVGYPAAVGPADPAELSVRVPPGLGRCRGLVGDVALERDLRPHRSVAPVGRLVAAPRGGIIL